MFGSGNTPGFGGFGANTSTTSPFSRPATSTFGAAPTGFGAPAASTNLFGSTPSFGSAAPAFGAAQTQSTGFGGFGATASPAGNTNLFGAPRPQTAPLFGAATGVPGVGAATAFGQPTASTAGQPGGSGGFTFGTAAAAPGTATAGTSLFGQPQQTAGSLSGVPGSSGGMFGSTTAGFGAAAATGTVVKFNPQTGTDTMVKNNTQQQINTKFLSISVMKEYAEKSFEELRVEDYLANRKGPQAGSSFGQPSGGLFGATTSAGTTGGLFGSTQNKPLFGTATTSAGGGLFGSSTPGVASATGGGLFGAAKPTGFATPTTSTSAFGGFGQPAAAASTGGFFGAGQQNKPLFGAAGSSGGLFGAAASQPSTGFGSTPAFGAAPAGGGLFGSSAAAPAASTTGFSFGSTTTSAGGAFGGFGQQAKPGGLFGSAAAPAAVTPFGQPAAASQPFAFNTAAAKPAGTTGFSGFGSTAAPAFGSTGAASGSLFNTSKPAGLTFGQPAAANANPFGGSSAFGFGANTSTAPAFGGFGTTQQPPAGGGLFGSAPPALGVPLGGQQLAAHQQNADVSQAQQFIISLTANQFGSSPLFRNLPESSVSRQELLNPTNPAAHQTITASLPYKVSPHIVNKLKPKPIVGTPGKASLFDGLDDDIADAVDVLTPRRSVKKLDIRAAMSPAAGSCSTPRSAAAAGSALQLGRSPSLGGGTPQQRPTSTSSAGAAGGATRDPPPLATPIVRSSTAQVGNRLALDPETPELIRGKLSSPLISKQTRGADDTIALMGVRKCGADTSRSEDRDVMSQSILLDETANEDEEAALADISGDPGPPHPSGVTLRRAGYYTLPALDELRPDPISGQLVVQDLTVGREAYGSVFLAGATDITGLDLDAIVFFRRREVCLYPDDTTKPPVGEGLNRRAQVTLERVWPTDKTTREPIVSADRLGRMCWEQRLERACLKLGAQFIEYRPETGSWVFKVNHFSKYGLNDSDEEEGGGPGGAGGGSSIVRPRAPPPPPPVQKKSLTPATKSTPASAAAAVSTLSPAGGGLVKPVVTNGFGQTHSRQNGHHTEKPDTDDEMHDGPGADTNGFYPLPMESPAVRMARSMDIDPEKIHSMRASFFMDEDEGIVDDNDSQMSEGYVLGQGSAFRPGLLSASGLVDKPPTKTSFAVGKAGSGGVASFSGALSGLGGTDMLSNSGLGGTLRLVSSKKTAEKSLHMEENSLSEQAVGSSAFGPSAAGHYQLQPPPAAGVGAAGGEMASWPGEDDLPTVDRSMMQDCPLLETTQYRDLPPVVPRFYGSVRPLQESNRLAAGYQLADMGSMMAHRSRVGWSSGWNLVHNSTAPALATQGRSLPTAIAHRSHSSALAGDPSEPFSLSCGLVVSTADLISQPEQMKDLYETLMSVQLRYSACTLEALSDVSSCRPLPWFNTQKDLSLMAALGSVHDRYSHVWQLVAALWGRLDFTRPTADDSDCVAYGAIQLRREALSRWLEAVCQSEVQKEVDSFTDDDYIKAVFSLLSVRKIYDAIVLAQRHGDLRLALLLSQLTGSLECRQMVRLQLENWHQIGADQYISWDRLRVYMLVAGIAVWETSGSIVINIFDGLDWHRSLALHLWYLSPSTDSVAQVLLGYDGSWEPTGGGDPLAQAPLPAHISASSYSANQHPQPSFDVCYQLLKLYCTGTASLDQLLTPASHTDEPLDHMLSWLLMECLWSLGYRHLPERQASQLHMNLAAQLESAQLWYLAVFVVLHIADPRSRHSACVDLLTRYVTLDLSDEVNDLLVDKLGIPRPVLADAMAVRARTLSRRRREVHFLLMAERWQQGHDLLVRDIAPECVINEQYEYLGDMLSYLAAPDVSSRVHGWSGGGQLYVDYIAVSEAVRAVMTSRTDTDQLERLAPTIQSLCGKVRQLPCPSATHTLAQAEIARKCVVLLRVLLDKRDASSSSTGCSSTASNLLSCVEQLQLPEDYALEELRHVLYKYMQEVGGV